MRETIQSCTENTYIRVLVYTYNKRVRVWCKREAMCGGEEKKENIGGNGTKRRFEWRRSPGAPNSKQGPRRYSAVFSVVFCLTKRNIPSFGLLPVPVSFTILMKPSPLLETTYRIVHYIRIRNLDAFVQR